MYDISPEFEILKKVPVVTRPVQIKLTRLYFKGLIKREVSKIGYCSSFSIPFEASPKKKITCLMYTPEGCSEDSPAVLFFHGGAFVFPALPYHFRLARHIATELNCRVFMPHYDLAPNSVPPIQQDEAWSVYNYLLENSESLSFDTKRIAVIGDSAGGTLCASLCLRSRKHGVQMPAAQALLYPSLDARLQSDSFKKYVDVPVCNSRSVLAYYKLCAPIDGVHATLEDRSPVEAESLKGMPPTYVETAEFDCLHDDGIAYVARLKEEGCQVYLNETRGTVHAYDFCGKSSILKDAMKKRISFLKDALEI